MKYKKTETGLWVRLFRDEPVIKSLLDLASGENIPSATISGIGAIRNTELGIYLIEDRRYDKKLFSETVELLNLTGNLSWFENKPALHCHAIIGDHNMHCFGGHLFEAEVAITVELFVSRKEIQLERKTDQNTGLNLLEF